MKILACALVLASLSGAPAHADNVKALIARSHAAEVKGQFNDAVMFLQAVIVAAPADPSSYVLLADLYARGDQAKTARVYFEDALFIDPTEPKALKGIALADLKLGDTDAAQASLDRLQETCGPRCPETLSVSMALEHGKKPGADAASTALDKH